MMDFVMEYIAPIFIVVLMVFTILIVGLFIKDYFFEDTSYCVCEKAVE